MAGEKTLCRDFNWEVDIIYRDYFETFGTNFIENERETANQFYYMVS